MDKLRHILVGGAGFLGLKICQILASENAKLKERHQIVVIDKEFSKEFLSRALSQRIEVLNIDISQPGELDKIILKETDVVHHLASNLIIPNEPRLNRYNYFAKTTIDGTRLLLKWLERSGCNSLIFWSTDMVYGYAESVPVNEIQPLKPLGPYGKTKMIAEKMIMDVVEASKLRATIFRPRLIIGAGRLGILVKLFKLVQGNLPVPIIGRGQNRFQFVGVSDCAKASIMAARLGCPVGIFNLGSLNPPTTQSLLNDFIHSVGSRSKVIPVPSFLIKSALECLNFLKLSPMDPEQYRIADKDIVVDIQKAQNLLGWIPEEDDLDMLLSAFETYRKL